MKRASLLPKPVGAILALAMGGLATLAVAQENIPPNPDTFGSPEEMRQLESTPADTTTAPAPRGSDETISERPLGAQGPIRSEADFGMDKGRALVQTQEGMEESLRLLVPEVHGQPKMGGPQSNPYDRRHRELY